MGASAVAWAWSGADDVVERSFNWVRAGVALTLLPSSPQPDHSAAAPQPLFPSDRPVNPLRLFFTLSIPNTHPAEAVGLIAAVA